MTIKEKLSLIDAYLSEEYIDKAWREMILEYRAWLQSQRVNEDSEQLLLMRL